MAVGFNLKFSRPQACVRCEPDPSRLASTLLPSGPPAKNGLSRLAGASARSYVRDMKRNFLLAGMLANVLWFPALSHAQDAPASPAAAAAERENTEANFKQVNMKVELLEEALRTQQRRITTLVDEIHTLRQDLDRLKSVRELIALAKTRPGELNYASGGVGSTPHLSAALFAGMAGVILTHPVPNSRST